MECCIKSDPTGNIYDEVAMPEIFKCSVTTNKATSFPHVKTSNKTESITTVNKLHCLCHQASKGNMIQCSECLNWYYTRCCRIKLKEMNEVRKIKWLGACCRVKRMKDEKSKPEKSQTASSNIVTHGQDASIDFQQRVMNLTSTSSCMKLVSQVRM